MSTRRPGKVTAFVVTMPCSLPNVTNDPVSETAADQHRERDDAQGPGALAVRDLDECDQRRGAAADAVEGRDELRHLRHLHAAGGDDRDDRSDRDRRDDPGQIPQLDAQHVGEDRESPHRPRRAGSHAARCGDC